MRLIGAADRGMQMMVQRALQRRAFGKLIAQHGSFLSDVARVRFLLLSLGKENLHNSNCFIKFVSSFSVILSEMIHDNELHSVELIWRKPDY